MGKQTTIEFSVNVFDSRSLTAVRDVVVTGCSPDDPSCREVAFGSSTTDSRGAAQLSVVLLPFNGRDAYSGVIELTHPDYVPQLVYLFPGAVLDTQIQVVMTPKAFFSKVAAGAGVPLGEGRGVVAIRNGDCSGVARRGMSLRLATPDPLTRTFYLGSTSAGEAAYDFGGVATGEAGVGGIFNVLAGTARIALDVGDLCLDVGTVEVGVRAGAITFVVVAPLQ